MSNVSIDVANVNIVQLDVSNPNKVFFQIALWSLHLCQYHTNVLSNVIVGFDRGAGQNLVQIPFLPLKWKRKIKSETGIQYKMALDERITHIW